MTGIDVNLLFALTVAFFVGGAAAYLGSFMVLKRMALVGDALTHVALPGMGIALAYDIDPFIGAFAALAIGIFFVWHIGKKTTIPAEAIVGIIFAISLAIGILVTPDPELLEALFGDISEVQFIDGAFAVILAFAVFAAMKVLVRRMLLGIISPDFAKSQGVDLDRLNLIFLMLVAVIVALGVKVVGTLLMGSLVIIPAAAAKNVARNFSEYGAYSAMLGALSGAGGIALAALLSLPPGPMVVLASGTIFLFSLALKRS